LLVDDDPSMLHALQRELRGAGYQLLTASSGEAALEILATREIPVILTDHHMEGMTGVELLTRARALWPDCVRMVLSGQSDFQVIAGAVNHGNIYKFLNKPWDSADLRSAVADAFEHYELVQRGAQFGRIFDHSSEGIFIVGRDGLIERINPAFTRITGYKPDDILGMRHEILHADGPESVAFNDIVAQVRESGMWSGEVWSRRGSGEIYPVALSISAIRDSNGHVSQYVGLCKDITESKEREIALRESEKRFRDFMEFAPIGMAIVALDGQLLKVNQAACNILGYPHEELEGMNFEDFTHPDDLAADLALRRRLLAGEMPLWQAEKRYLKRDGNLVWVQLTASVLRDTHGQPQCFDAQLEDISERKRQQEQIRQLAYFDALTGLPNRRLLQDRLEQAVAQARRNQRRVAVAFLDLDHFKRVNDVHGHDVGDELLTLAAQRLITCVRRGDTVARQGGDEFILVLADIGEDAGVQRVAEKIVAALAMPFSLPQSGLTIDFISTSLGLAVFPTDGLEPQDLMKKADLAMYAAKEGGRNGYRRYVPGMGE
jgi:diguanylate cyclase (GGDEF)-like protein/PAS domain S-box-containing protein